MPNKQPLTADWTEPEAREEVLSGHMQNDIVRIMLRQFDVYLEANKNQLAQAAGLSLNEYKALEFVLEFKPLSPGKLAQLLDLSPSGTQALITRLESAGYLLRKPHPRDGRMTILYPNQERCKRLITDMNLPCPSHHGCHGTLQPQAIGCTLRFSLQEPKPPTQGRFGEAKTQTQLDAASFSCCFAHQCP